MAVTDPPSHRRRGAPRRSAVALVGALVPALTLAAPATASHLVDTAGSAHEAMIHAIVDAGISVGCDPAGTRYCPEDAVTRGQMATFLSRALALPPGDDDHFRDDDGSTHERAINRLHEEGITLGRPDGTFDPGGQVTRAQMASFLARAFEIAPVEGQRFVDVGGTHAANVNGIAAAGITTGCDASGTRFCPDAPVLRGQMASFLGRALGLDDGAAPEEPADGAAGAPPPSSGGSGTTSVVPLDPEGPPPDRDVPEPQYVERDRAAALPWPDVAGDGDFSAQLYDGERVLAGSSNWAQSTVPQVGRLFSQRLDGRTGFCSGTVVAPTLVLTAAHCVLDDAGQERFGFTFAPALSGDSRPYGTWQGLDQPVYFREYLQGGVSGHVLDYAFVRIPPAQDGTRLGDHVGTYPVLLNSHGLGLPRLALGYPGEGWYRQWGGDYLWMCESADVQWFDWGSGWASKGSGCTANGGFSGGPVFEQYNGQWYVAGVNSTMTYAPEGGDRSTHWLINVWSPSLNDWYNTLFEAASG